MFDKFVLLFNTLKHLKLSQIFWQFIYRLKGKRFLIRKQNNYAIHLLKISNKLVQSNKYLNNNCFRFLNLEKEFEKINWNFMSYGKLWNYNLEYFDYLRQNDLCKEEKLGLIHSFYDFSIENKRILEPYPVSLRTINVISFCSTYDLKDDKVLNCLYQELDFLEKNLEYHILGNHLLENGFALLIGGAFYNEERWRIIAERLLLRELKEQILADGAHFELSPMYHEIIFYRVLELIDWYDQYENKNEAFLHEVKDIAVKMESFLRNIIFENGDIPHFNDSSDDIAYTSNELLNYFEILGLKSDLKSLNESGYRSMKNDDFEIKIDVAQLAVSYQPGHAHADSLSFILYYKGKPFIVEQGTSTYQIDERRAVERSSQAHNTVTIKRENHSEVWSGFRVGKRAFTQILKDETNYIKAQHDGYYKKYNVIHTREYDFKTDFQINDEMTIKSQYESFLHFDASLSPYIENNMIKFKEIELQIFFEGESNIKLESYRLANGYNCYLDATRAVIMFDQTLQTIISRIQ